MEEVGKQTTNSPTIGSTLRKTTIMTQPTNYHLSSGGSRSTALLSPTHTAIETRDPMTRTEKNKAEAVSIRPGVQILSILQHLNYKPWFALAEFVDNSIQSYLANAERLRALHGDGFIHGVRNTRFCRTETNLGHRIFKLLTIFCFINCLG